MPDVIDYDEILSKLGRADRADVWARRYYRRKRYWPTQQAIVEGVRLEDARLSGCPYAQVRPMSLETARAGLSLAKHWQETRPPKGENHEGESHKR